MSLLFDQSLSRKLPGLLAAKFLGLAALGLAGGLNMREAWRVYLISALLSCVVGAGTAFVTVRLLVNAPAQAPTNGVPVAAGAPSSPNTLIWEDVVEVRTGSEPEVFYKTPFATPPYLTFPDGLAKVQCEVIDQKAGSFKLRRAGAVPYGTPNPAQVKWKAEGQPASK